MNQVTVGSATVTHLNDRLLVRYAVVAPYGTAPRGRDLLAPAAWDVLRGHQTRWFLVRAAVPASAGATTDADAVLIAVIPRLQALTRTP